MSGEQEQEQEQEVRSCFERFAAAWNAHDVTAMVACWAPAGTAIDPWGRFAAGQEGVGRLLGGEHESSMRQSRYTIRDVQVRTLSAESVVAVCDAVIEGVLAPNAATYDLPHRVDAVLVKQGEWRFLSLHPSFSRA